MVYAQKASRENIRKESKQRGNAFILYCLGGGTVLGNEHYEIDIKFLPISITGIYVIN